ncbi:MAG: aspartyl/asparaginyl beta-hydroxylase domain-containing protein [Bacteroidota bacterium]|nr:aspartyl/asparaginyl beta-hydroxylase domain-containing protein [Bacteroidota bacterium]MDP4229526.1 aspartyl/asparaginyl beta-hydroxylase domain-containing protein [Bacteroidota bacterium]MDP4236411.1 aspartyl/asparaginyl beta-hydroxylase domain-containing protein [Bacteroidota bacterium]
MIESFRLPFTFEIADLLSDLENFAGAEWLPHFNTSYYEGDWDGLALRAPGGKLGSIYPGSISQKEFADTPWMPHFRSVEKILETFQCSITSVRFLRLKRGSAIREHSDNALSFEDGEVRLHIPVITNDVIEFKSNGRRLLMKEGECWYINAGLPHSVENNSEIDRIHLVIDCKVNDWLKSFFPNEPEIVKNGLSSIRSEKDRENMIIALRSIGTPAALKIIDDLLHRELTNG